MAAAREVVKQIGVCKTDSIGRGHWDQGGLTRVLVPSITVNSLVVAEFPVFTIDDGRPLGVTGQLMAKRTASGGSVGTAVASGVRCYGIEPLKEIYWVIHIHVYYFVYVCVFLWRVCVHVYMYVCIYE